MRPGPDWLPYFGPMLAFIGILSLGDYVGEGYDLPLMAARVLVPAALFLYFWTGGSYPELKSFQPGGGAVLDLLVGLLVTAVWVAPYLIWKSLQPDAAEAFDPNSAGESNRALILGLRFAGFALVTPFIEELLVRSYLIRIVEVYNDEDADFRRIAIGTFGWMSFGVTLAWFTFTHVQWEWPVAFAAGLIYNLWLYKRKHIGSLILAHAVTNASLFALVVLSEDDLWFFL